MKSKVFLIVLRMSLILSRKTLMLRDVEERLIFCLMTDTEAQVPGVTKLIVPQIQGIMPGEFEHDSSDRPDYNFLAHHISWYN